MKEILADIRAKLQQGLYKNEEHVCLSLVARLLQALGWDIWNPGEVYTEFKPVPAEDNTKVDFALFLGTRSPVVFIEVKAVGKVDQNNLSAVEKQLRNYNRDNTATFSIITDGRVWRFYYSRTGGTFRDKCFETLDLLADDPGDVETALVTFLGRVEVDPRTGSAASKAEELLVAGEERRAMYECLPRARRLTQEPPYPSLPDALIDLVAEQGHTVSREQAEEFISKQAQTPPSPPPPEPVQPPPGPPIPVLPAPGQVIQLQPERPDSLTFTSMTQGRIGPRAASNWNGLVREGIKIASEAGHSISDLRRWLGRLGRAVAEGRRMDAGRRPVEGTGFSWQGVDSNDAWASAFALAKGLNVAIEARFRWQYNDNARCPGQEGILQWSPESSGGT